MAKVHPARWILREEIADKSAHLQKAAKKSKNTIGQFQVIERKHLRKPRSRETREKTYQLTLNLAGVGQKCPRINFWGNL
ncbi:MAG: hypothetical protein AMJ94_00330 [Deltaproteobacteria bacterium SM23_61]|nr:MAG: hypothetical protein AMJ94_00330 [Deltaproteobacteria bacterium SM23_61]